MAAWFSIVAPLLPELIRATRPMFTRTRAPDKVPQQILELQDAVEHNDRAIKALASEMEHTIAALRSGAGELERTIAELRAAVASRDMQLRNVQLLAAAATTAAVLAFGLAAWALAQ